VATRDSGRGNEACPWESPGPGPGHETCKKDNNDSESDTKCTSDNFRSGNSITNRVTRRPTLLTNNPSSDSMNLHSTSADLGQVELDLENNTSTTSINTGGRKKSSSSMLAGEEETVVKKTSKSSEPAGACALVSSEVFDKVDTDDLTAVAGPSGAPLSCKDNKDSSTGEVAGAEAGAGGGQGENGCWISSSQEVCPWEDDTLTPTWL